jgi:CRP/FNR family transcriptional regulator
VIIIPVATGEETVALLRAVPMFDVLSPDEMQRVAEVAVPRSFTRGEMVFREGDKGDTCYVVREGMVRITRRHPGGRTIALAEMRTGDMFGELAMFDGETRSATAETLEDTELVALLASDMRRLLLSHAEMAVKMLSQITQRLRDANERVSRQSFQTVASRVAGALLSQVEAIDEEGVEASNVLVATTQAELAELAGSSRESASRFLATLEREGLVKLSRGKVLVHDPGALRNYIY